MSEEEERLAAWEWRKVIFKKTFTADVWDNEVGLKLVYPIKEEDFDQIKPKPLPDGSHVIYELQTTARHLNLSQILGAGGVIASLLDAAFAGAIGTHLRNREFASTVEMKINFIRPFMEGTHLYCYGKVCHWGKTHIVVEAEVKEKDSGKLVAKGMSTFNKYLMNASL